MKLNYGNSPPEGKTIHKSNLSNSTSIEKASSFHPEESSDRKKARYSALIDPPSNMVLTERGHDDVLVS